MAFRMAYRRKAPLPAWSNIVLRSSPKSEMPRKTSARTGSALAARQAGARLVLTAHGRDVRNIGSIPGVCAPTRKAVVRADAVIAVSDFLRRDLEAKLPEAQGKVVVIDSGVDLERFRLLELRRNVQR